MPFLFYFTNGIANDKLFLSNVTIRLFEHCRSTSNIDDTLAELTLVRLVFAIESLVGNNNTLCPIGGSRMFLAHLVFRKISPLWLRHRSSPWKENRFEDAAKTPRLAVFGESARVAHEKCNRSLRSRERKKKLVTRYREFARRETCSRYFRQRPSEKKKSMRLVKESFFAGLKMSHMQQFKNTSRDFSGEKLYTIF